MGDGRPPALAHVPQRGDVCRIHLTSGTTGESKGVALTHDMMLGRVLRYCAAYGNRFPRSARVFCDLTWGTALGFQMLIYTLAKTGLMFEASVGGQRFKFTPLEKK